MSKPILGYWDIRGRAQPIRLLLTYLGTDFEDKRYGFGGGPPSWGADKSNLSLDFPNLPYWIEENEGLKLTETKAILKYIAQTRRGGALFPQTPELQAVAEMFEGIMTDLLAAMAAVVFSATGIPEKPLEETQAEKMKQVNSFLAKRKWAIGDSLSYVDFFAYEMLKKYTKYNKEFLNPYPAIINYFQNFEGLPGLVEYIKGSETLLSFAPMAKLKF